VPVPKERIAELLGKRVHLETTDFHHLLGTLEARRDARLVLRVQGQEVQVPVRAVASLSEAGPHEAEFLK
jgi:hypothetical protein